MADGADLISDAVEVAEGSDGFQITFLFVLVKDVPFCFFARLMTHCATIHRPQNNDLAPFSNYSWLFDHTGVGSIFSISLPEAGNSLHFD
jgi:hypothetical protein